MGKLRDEADLIIKNESESEHDEEMIAIRMSWQDYEGLVLECKKDLKYKYKGYDLIIIPDGSEILERL